MKKSGTISQSDTKARNRTTPSPRSVLIANSRYKTTNRGKPSVQARAAKMTEYSSVWTTARAAAAGLSAAGFELTRVATH